MITFKTLSNAPLASRGSLLEQEGEKGKMKLTKQMVKVLGYFTGECGDVMDNPITSWGAANSCIDEQNTMKENICFKNA